MGNYDYSQNDPRWKDIPLGFSTSWYIGNHGGNNSISGGCAVTSLAMMASHLGHVVDPAEMNALMKANGLINANGDFIRSDILTRIWPDISYMGRLDWPKDPAPLPTFDIKDDLNTEIMVLIDVRAAPGIQQHWLRVVGWDGANDVIVVDPWDGKRKGISSYAARESKTVSKIIYAAIKFRRTVTVPQQTPAPTPQPVAIPAPKPPAESEHPANPGANDGVDSAPPAGDSVVRNEETAPPPPPPVTTPIPVPGHRLGNQANTTQFVRALKRGADFLVHLAGMIWSHLQSRR